AARTRPASTTTTRRCGATKTCSALRPGATTGTGISDTRQRTGCRRSAATCSAGADPTANAYFEFFATWTWSHTTVPGSTTASDVPAFSSHFIAAATTFVFQTSR